MITVLKQLHTCLRQGQSVVWVSIILTRGSSPREAGATMLVTERSFHGTIGGGTLEFLAIDEARALLQDKVRQRRLSVVNLGPDTGQCCGGQVEVLSEYLSVSDLPWVDQMMLKLEQQEAVTVFRDLHNSQSPARCLEADDSDKTLRTSWQQLWQDADCCLLKCHQAGRLYVLQKIQAPPQTVAIFGAGHVGRALVRAMSPLPLQIVWIDPRQEQFTENRAPNVRIVSNKDNAAVLQELPASTIILVLTFSHALDFQICAEALKTGKFQHLGLIGSKSKKLALERYLKQAGLGVTHRQQLVCPIGLPGIKGKQPAIIAASVAAQCLLWMQEKQNSTAMNQSYREDVLG